MAENDPAVEKGNQVIALVSALLPAAIALFRSFQLLFRKRK
ncbi:TPA_asm: hypothetical protein [ssRNA phage Esthiorhiza.2_51]|uniref:Uncharacterized protein n=2 Tax=Fiersviridae TaxID=2842319 RepID=A0A8S5L1N9_9VIRU|nr:hypothetical protein QIK70_gp4 [ssRNA phage Esthiorhiza.2_51]QDH90699.1 MAG: hypothetical protein H2RhizoLitter8480_000002 [Leviviridae sp.]DAD51561.1 TPA_asm: hypothetical protein [ssRNA phage Esthiorhiza.2_51]